MRGCLCSLDDFKEASRIEMIHWTLGVSELLESIFNVRCWIYPLCDLKKNSTLETGKCTIYGVMYSSNLCSFLFIWILSIKIIFLNLIATNEMKLINSSFCSNLKFWKIPKITYFIAIQTWGLLPWSAPISNFIMTW